MIANQGEISPMLSSLKGRLLKAGPGSGILLQAFRLQAATRGVTMQVADGRIFLKRGRRMMILGVRDAISVPFVVREWSRFFYDLEGEVQGNRTVLDFSEPALHRYRKLGLSFHAPSLAEDDSMEAYTAAYRPRVGDVVWDVGAHVGMSAYLLSKMVGPTGKVYAFEPDETNYDYLLLNIERHGLSNVTPVKAALSEKTGRSVFCMDGTMSAGLIDSLAYQDNEHGRMVATLGLEDACRQFGSVPAYIKLDIEGAELGVIQGALEFLKTHWIHFSMETNHRVGGRLSSGPLETLFSSVGYRAWSSKKFGQRFTWAEPPSVGGVAAS
jgi:FkbM family methyltransferase